ncbi:MAG: universal stress protein [Symploca sp. SIO3C6]|uniref:Universal stress protein n=1 Tax=Symploca sp. SIO1C4 TaxID=2607765 RepID=A0A6B3NLA6_9CYAN|nr:universal stress protein [Symploca sp. SIO3C6]NER30944.1 universal stress protein [Symploca sp. SIO1C4]
MVINKILVALDRSEQAQVVFEQALELAKKLASSLLLFNCLDWEEEGEISSFIEVGTLADIGRSETAKQLRHESLQKDIEQVKSLLQIYCQQAQDQGVDTEVDCKVGDPGSRICNLAKSWGADLIILGRRGHKGITEMFLGSISNHVVHNAPCSVFVVQGIKPRL